VDETAGHAKPVKTKLLDLMMLFFGRQDEQFEPLGEVVGNLSDHEPGPVGVEALAREKASAEAVFELLDVVLGSTAGEVMSEDTRRGAAAVGDDGAVEELTDDALLTLIEGASLDDHPKGLGPTDGSIGDLGPLGAVFPGIGMPAFFRNGVYGRAKGRREFCRDGELKGSLDEIHDNIPSIEAGIHAQVDHPAFRQAREAFTKKALRPLSAGLVPRTESHTEEESLLRPEAKQRVQTLDLGVPVSRAFLEVAVDGEDGAIEIEGDGDITPDQAGGLVGRCANDAFELFDVSGREFCQVLAGGRGRRDVEIVEVLPSGGFASECIEIGQMTPSGEEVVDETHDEVADWDASGAFLDRATLQSFENAELVSDIGDELQAGKRGDRVL